MLGLFAPIVVVFLCIAAGLWLTWRGCRRAMGAAPDPAVCAACGTPAVSLTGSFVCPGCGRDVRALGLTPWAVRRRAWLHPVVWVTLWSAAVTIGAGASLVSHEFHRSSEILRKEMRLEPPQGQLGLRSATISLDALRSADRSAVTGSTMVTLVTDTTFATLYIDAASKQATVTGDGMPTSSPAPLSDATFDDLARAAGLDPSDKPTHEQLVGVRVQLAKMIAELSNTTDLSMSSPVNVFSSMSGSSSGSSMPARTTGRWPIAAAAALWFA